MKQLKFFAAGIFLITACNSAKQNNNSEVTNDSKKTAITIKGSDTVLPLSQKCQVLFQT